MGPAISEAVEEYCQESGDRRASFFELTDAVDLRGARNHPGRGAHELAARELAEKLTQLLS